MRDIKRAACLKKVKGFRVCTSIIGGIYGDCLSRRHVSCWKRPEFFRAIKDMGNKTTRAAPRSGQQTLKNTHGARSSHDMPSHTVKTNSKEQSLNKQRKETPAPQKVDSLASIPEKMLSPENQKARQVLQALKEELAQTHLRVHFYEKQRENFEHDHQLPLPWGGTGDNEEEIEDQCKLTSAQKLALLRKQLSRTQTERQRTQKHVTALQCANGRTPASKNVVESKLSHINFSNHVSHSSSPDSGSDDSDDGSDAPGDKTNGWL